MKHRLLFCRGESLLAYTGTGGGFSNLHEFPATEGGYQTFAQYLQTNTDHPVYLLLDLAEEAFHLDTVPYAWGRERTAMLARCKAKYFRNSEWHSISVQARQNSGRRDLEVLISGLDNAGPLKPWADILYAARVPLKGIYSQALVGQSLLPALYDNKSSNPSDKRLLLVTQQTQDTLRYSFYDNGLLKLSRLVVHPSEPGYLSAADALHTEISNTLIYLRSQRLLSREETFAVAIIANRALYAVLAPNLHSDGHIRYTLYQRRVIAARCGISTDLPTDFCDGLFAHCLLNQAAINHHYGAPHRVRFYRYRKLKKNLYIAASILLIVSTAIAVTHYRQVQLLQRDQRQIVAEKIHLDQSPINKRPRPPLPADAITSAVGVINTLKIYANLTPLRALSAIAQALSFNNTIKIRQIHWLTHPKADIALDNYTQRPRSMQRTNEDNTLDYEIIGVEGEVLNQAGNYRDTLTLFEAFINTLRESGQYSLIDIEKTPLGIDSRSHLVGDNGTTSPKDAISQTDFRLRLTLIPNAQ